MDATRTLNDLACGNLKAAAALLPEVYDALHQLAAAAMQREPPGHTLQATALVHEAYLRLIDQTQTDWNGRSHFFALAAQAVRRILIDHARARSTQKRGGGFDRVTLQVDLAEREEAPLDLLALEEALTRLETLSTRQARIIELRFFGGLTIEETAAVFGISDRMVQKEWRMARAWLMEEMSGENWDRHSGSSDRPSA